MGNLASRSARFRPRDASGRFRTYRKPHDHSACGKGQYKSKECKARAIRQNAIETGEASPKQQKYISWLERQGL